MTISTDAKTIDETHEDEGRPARLPMVGLLALAMAGFITILTEALPAGLLPQISEGLMVSEALVEEVGFEPTVRFPARRFSRPVP